MTVKKNFFKRLLFLDIVLLSAILIYSFSIISFYLNGEFIGTGYEDWMVHAYRVKLLDTYGLVSWSHSWANGIDIWKAYQIIPHVMTLGFVHLFDVSAAKGMLYITIFMFIFLRFTMYISLRMLGFHPLTAFFCSLASLDIAQFWGGVSDFSLMFGIAFTPLIIYLWTQFYSGKMVYLYPFIVGMSFYLHPVLGYTASLLLALGILTSGQQIISMRTFTQFFILILTASLFWYPVLTKESYIYSSPFLTDQFFLNQVIKNYGYSGTSLFIILSIPLALIGLFLNIKKTPKWAGILYVFACIYFLLIIIGAHYPLPKVLAQLQFTRGVSIIAICFLFVFAVFLEHFFRGKSTFIKALFLVALIPIILEANAILKEHSPDVTTYIPDPVASFSNKSIDDGKIWTSSIGTSSYFSPTTYQFPYSYMGHLDSNVISPRISQIIIYKSYPEGVPVANIDRMLEYFKITGTKYAFFYQQSPYVGALTNKETSFGFIDLGYVRSYDTLFHAFQSPFEPIEAAVIAPANVQKLFQFPKKVGIADVQEQVTIDENVEAFNKIIYTQDNTRLDVEYPYNHILTVTIPEKRVSNIIYIAESYDTNWKGVYNNESVAIEPVGPNFIKVTLPENTGGGQLQLERVYSFYSIVLPFLIALTGILIVLHMYLTRKIEK